MRQFPKLRPCIWDGLVVLAVALLAVFCGVTVWGGQEEAQELSVVISVDGVEELRTPLVGSRPVIHTVRAGGYTLEVALSDNGVWVEASDCPTQDCVHTGVINRGGQSIVCLPARIVVQMVGTSGGDGPDLIIG